jgi:hypothetical protein
MGAKKYLPTGIARYETVILERTQDPIHDRAMDA